MILSASLLCVSKFSAFYNSVFRLTSSQAQDLLSSKPSSCSILSVCKLEPGDILIRRYITSQTRLADFVFHPYFTHSAMYLGNDQIVEAVGTEKDSRDDIQISSFSKSDWLDPGIERWVIVRPRNIRSKFETIKRNLEHIANDPDYIFGLPREGYKRTTCADLIFEQLYPENVKRPVTPDYLFSRIVDDSDNFEIIGYSITDKN